MQSNTYHLVSAINVVSISLVTVALVAKDGRSFRSAITKRYSSRITAWNTIIYEDIYHEGWCRVHLRCNMHSFLSIVNLITSKWHEVNLPIGRNSYFFHRERVAVTIHFLTHGGTVSDSAQCFGMSKSSALRFISEVIRVLVNLRDSIIFFPRTNTDLIKTAEEFERIAGFPNVVGAIDGTLIEIQRPDDYEGWYCRKGFCAFNVQAVCDWRRKFLSFAIFPGSMNDKSMFSSSDFGKNCHKYIPREKHLLGDAGYVLQNHLLTPFDIYEVMPKDQRIYNYLHSKTRIVVEGAFGILKQRFRVFSSPLNQSSLNFSSEIIQGCFVLHNILIDLNDDVLITYDMQEGPQEEINAYNIPTSSGIHKRELLKGYLNSLHI